MDFRIVRHSAQNSEEVDVVKKKKSMYEHYFLPNFVDMYPHFGGACVVFLIVSVTFLEVQLSCRRRWRQHSPRKY